MSEPIETIGWVDGLGWKEFTHGRKWNFDIRQLPNVFRFSFKTKKDFWNSPPPIKVKVTIEVIEDTP